MDLYQRMEVNFIRMVRCSECRGQDAMNFHQRSGSSIYVATAGKAPLVMDIGPLGPNSRQSLIQSAREGRSNMLDGAVTEVAMRKWSG
jgi:hypothetical protein